MFTEKHYKAIAEIIEETMPSFKTTREDIGKAAACRNIARDLADYFAGDNPRFDRTKFMVDCGLE